MNFWTVAIGLLVLYIIYRTYKKNKLKKEKELNDKLLADLQKAHDTKDYKEVIRLIDNKELTNARLCYVYGNALLMTGQTEKGRSIFKKAFSFGDKNETRKIFGFAELNAGHHKEAISLLQEIEKDYLAFQFKYDDGYDIVENLGIAFMELEKYDLAIEAFKGAPLGKKNITDGLNKIFILLGQCYEKKGDTKNAMKFYTKSVAYKYNDDLQSKIENLQADK
ncbi:MAG: tetratricopeptide repeat protein [Cyclobacteriaceae bacterium]|nr:tetratricopeptide repeat protein [Cyclobacteriaceae bacterium]